MRRTKIIATMGPAIEDPKVLSEIIADVDIIRINFSHGNHSQFRRHIRMIRSIAGAMNKNIGILGDLRGPEIRIDENRYALKQNQKVSFRYGQGDPGKNIIGISHALLYKLLKPGMEIFADDGHFHFQVKGIEGRKIITQVQISGLLEPRKSINIPQVNIGLPILSKQDKKDIRSMAKKIDWLAASFVSTGRDVDSIRHYIKKVGLTIPIISKIENATSIAKENLSEIIRKSDGIMAARGDLGVELPPEQVPQLQREIIHLSKQMGKPIIIATQMLESMIRNPRPTRAESTDVYNAALAKVDALMLSAETASGRYPLEAVRMMDRLIRACQTSQSPLFQEVQSSEKIYNICKAGIDLGTRCHSQAVITISRQGKSPRILSSFRGKIPVVASCTNRTILRRSSLYYSVYPIYIRKSNNAMTAFKEIEEKLKKEKWVKSGDHVIFLHAYPSAIKSSANSLREWYIS